MSEEAGAVLQLDNAVISLQFVLGAVMSAMAWWLKRQDVKIDQLEKGIAQKVSLDVYNNTLESLRREIREQGHQTQERIDKLLTLMAERKP